MSKQTEDNKIVRLVTRAVREADQTFLKTGGTSRHWVTECFLPAMEGNGLKIILDKTTETL
jgi:catechol-2,3-dioxygenase